MYTILQHAHSGLRWLVLALLVIAVARASRRWRARLPYEAGDRKLYMFTMISVHLQLLLGLILYFISPMVQFTGEAMKNSVTRFYTVEHIFLMLIAIALITIGHVRGKKKAPDASSHRNVFTFFLIGLILILIGIPWPFRGLGAGWF